MNCLASLDHLASWLELYNQHKEYSAFSVIVGNKRDLTTKYPSHHAGNARQKSWRSG